MITVTQGQGNSESSVEVGLNTCKMASWKGWEPNEKNEFGSVSISYRVGNTFVNENLAIPRWVAEDDYDKRKLEAFSKNIFIHLHMMGVTQESFNNFVRENFVEGFPSDAVASPEGLAMGLEKLIPSKDVEGHLLVHLGGKNKHYPYQGGCGVIRTFKGESFEDLITVYNSTGGSKEKMPEHIRAWGQSYLCPFFTTPVEVNRVELGIIDYRNPADLPEVKEWTVVKEVVGDSTFYYYTDRFNWEPKVDAVSSEFNEDDTEEYDAEAEAQKTAEIFGLED